MHRLLLLISILSILNGCARKGNEAELPQNSGGTAIAAETQSDPDSVAKTTESSNNADEGSRPQTRPTTGGSASVRIPPARLLPVTRSDRLLSIDAVVVTYPSDFLIGSLYRPSRDGDAQAIARISDRFLREIIAGKLSTETVHEEWIEHLARSLKPFFDGERDIEASRFAEPVIADEGFAEMTIRLFSRVGEASGTIFFELQGRRWYVVDFHAILNNLTVPAMPRSEPFEPPATNQRG